MVWRHGGATAEELISLRTVPELLLVLQTVGDLKCHRFSGGSGTGLARCMVVHLWSGGEKERKKAAARAMLPRKWIWT